MSAAASGSATDKAQRINTCEYGNWRFYQQ